MRVEFSPPDITEEEIAEVIDTLKSGWITTGPKTKKFEQEIAQFCGTTKAACLSSATTCMEMTLRAMGIGPGDEVITSAYTFTATCSVNLPCGGNPCAGRYDAGFHRYGSGESTGSYHREDEGNSYD